MGAKKSLLFDVARVSIIALKIAGITTIIPFDVIKEIIAIIRRAFAPEKSRGYKKGVNFLNVINFGFLTFVVDILCGAPYFKYRCHFFYGII